MARAKEGRVRAVPAPAGTAPVAELAGDRIEDAHAYLAAATTANPRPKGILVLVFDEEGFEGRSFGEVLKTDIAFVAATMMSDVGGREGP